MTPLWQVLDGDCRDVLRTLPDQSVHTVVTSPPYFGLRDYGTGEWTGGDPGCDHVKGEMRRGLGLASSSASTRGGGHKAARVADIPYGDVCGKCGAERIDRQIGLEPTPDEFVEALVDVFREVRRVLRDDGTVWLNLGDSYASRAQPRTNPSSYRADRAECTPPRPNVLSAGVKAKDLLGIPWMVAFALRADDWYLRADVIWHKPNPMPESVRDRPTNAHEYLFLLSKSRHYYYDAQAIAEPLQSRPSDLAKIAEGRERGAGSKYATADGSTVNGAGSKVSRKAAVGDPARGRNKRSVWTVATSPFAGAHFATFPPKLITPCVLAGAPRAGVVLDPFSGAGTTGLVAVRHGRAYIGIELNADYAGLARERIEQDVRLGHRQPRRVPDPLDGQLDMLGEAAA